MGWTFKKYGYLYDGDRLLAITWEPSKDLNHSARMEKKIEEMGLGDVYGAALLEIAREGANEITDDEGAVAYVVAHASAYERVQAAWKVLND